MIQVKKLFLGLISLFLLINYTVAQTTIEGDDLIYVVQPGDTLYNISEKFLEDPKYWPNLANDARVQIPQHMQPGQTIRLPLELLRHELKDIRVAFGRGEAFVVQPNGVSRPLTRGMVLREGQTVKTGADGFVSLLLPDESRLFLSANSSLKIQYFRHVTDVDRDLTEFVLEEGYVETKIQTQRDNSRFRVSTPLSVTGVRGTVFGVSYDRHTNTQTNDVMQGRVAIDHSVQERQGWGTRAVSASADGVMLNGGQGAIFEDDMTRPQVTELMAAPDLSGWSDYVHEKFWVFGSLDAPADQEYLVSVYPANKPYEVLFQARGVLGEIGPIEGDGVYEIQVRALGANGIPGMPATHQVTLKSQPLAPLLQSPANGVQVITGANTLLCTNTPGINRYWLQIARDAKFNNIVEELSSNQGCRFEWDVSETGMYYWRVASVDAKPSDIEIARGEFSAVGNFDVIPAPLVPTLDQEQTLQGVMIHWREETPGSRYTVQVSNRSDFSEIFLEEQTNETQIALDITYSCSKMFVRIQSVEPSGFVSEFSQPRELQVPQVWCTESGAVITDSYGKPVILGTK